MNSSSEIKTVSIVGASGYTGGEALRILLAHPFFRVQQVTSERLAGKPVSSTHPNLRGICDLKFEKAEDLSECDILFLGLPHGESQNRFEEFAGKAGVLCDLASDFRIKDGALYEKFYGHIHSAPALAEQFTYAVPEVNRQEIGVAKHFAGAGCIATCSLISLYPLFASGILREQRAFIDAKIGSSATGASPSPASHHPERAGCLRSFQPTGHRHTAELLQYLPNNGERPEVYLSATSTSEVRGILTTAQVFVDPQRTEADVWGVYREHYNSEPFVRIVKDKRSIYRYPEPKLLRGTNFVDIGFELEPETGRLVVMSAIDNLVKGSAGNIVQSLNIRFGYPERLGLEFVGLHPA
ncbi:MAG: N-acetyl-gamma-glutamyl-phosphate reductase [Bdellovibrionales bacterium]|nr:N-acetyl-gamma-glutamyl-phosphate reductase [Bdellovibrionales bacterium]